jgi:hypothetical protein
MNQYVTLAFITDSLSRYIGTTVLNPIAVAAAALQLTAVTVVTTVGATAISAHVATIVGVIGITVGVITSAAAAASSSAASSSVGDTCCAARSNHATLRAVAGRHHAVLFAQLDAKTLVLLHHVLQFPQGFPKLLVESQVFRLQNPDLDSSYIVQPDKIYT